MNATIANVNFGLWNIRGLCLHYVPARLYRVPRRRKTKMYAKVHPYNNMNPEPISDELKNFSPFEKMLRTRVYPVICRYKIRGG